ncbi:MAG: hypothetical protein U0359_21475 [Byssovorax sp.]
MASETEQDAPRAEDAEAPDAPKDAADPETSSDRRDEAGLPVDRPPTLDDVRGNDGTHRLAAIGCTAVVLLLVLGFWAVRVLWLR